MDVIRRRIMNHNPYTSQGVLKNTYRNVNAECQELAKYVEIKNTYASSIEFFECRYEPTINFPLSVGTTWPSSVRA
jgi:hypothetical protein